MKTLWIMSVKSLFYCKKFYPLFDEMPSKTYRGRVRIFAPGVKPLLCAGYGDKISIFMQYITAWKNLTQTGAANYAKSINGHKAPHGVELMEHVYLGY